jgi:hypothetical protein
MNPDLRPAGRAGLDTTVSISSKPSQDDVAPPVDRLFLEELSGRRDEAAKQAEYHSNLARLHSAAAARFGAVIEACDSAAERIKSLRDTPEQGENVSPF